MFIWKMFKNLSILHKTFSVLGLVGVICGSIMAYNSYIKTNVIQIIEIKEEKLKNDDLKAIIKSDENFHSKSDCDKLSIVYNSDQCKTGQKTFGTNMGNPFASKEENPIRTGQNSISEFKGEMQTGSVLSDQSSQSSLQKINMLYYAVEGESCDKTSEFVDLLPFGCSLICIEESNKLNLECE